MLISPNLSIFVGQLLRNLPGRTLNIYCVTIIFAFLAAFSLHAEEYSIEYKIKAGYLYNFTKFIDWPVGLDTHPDQDLRICLLGDDPFGRVLGPIKRKKSKGRQIQLIRFERMSAEVVQYQILFIAGSEFGQIQRIFDNLSGVGVLTVGDGEKFASNGGMVGFVIDAGRVRLQINRAAVEEAGLNISAKLLEVAQIVEMNK